MLVKVFVAWLKSHLLSLVKVTLDAVVTEQKLVVVTSLETLLVLLKGFGSSKPRRLTMLLTSIPSRLWR